MNILIQCGDHLENQHRIITLAATLKGFGCSPIVLMYSKEKGRFFENFGIRTIALEDHISTAPVEKGTTVDSFLEEGIKYNDVLQPEQQRRPRVGWPGQRTRTISDIHRNYGAIKSIIDTCKPAQIVVWNGFTGYVANILRLIANNRNIPSAFLERGLIKNSLFIDRKGVNGASSLSDVTPEFIDSLVLTPEETQNVTDLFNLHPPQPETPSSLQRKVFFPLQVQLDTNIIMYSPYKSMREVFFQIYDKLNSHESQFLVRPHPEELPETLPNMPRYENVKTTNKETLEHWIDWSDVVVTINSTVGLEALIRGKKVISLGDSIYSAAGLTSSLSKELDLSNRELHIRLTKYLAYVLRTNLLISNGLNNALVVGTQLNLDENEYLPLDNLEADIPSLQEATIELDFPLTTTLDLTYRKNNVKVDNAWIIGIAKKHVNAKRYLILPHKSKPTTATAIKVVNESKSAKADKRFSKTIDIYGNIVR